MTEETNNPKIVSVRFLKNNDPNECILHQFSNHVNQYSSSERLMISEKYFISNSFVVVTNF